MKKSDKQSIDDKTKMPTSVNAEIPFFLKKPAVGVKKKDPVTSSTGKILKFKRPRNRK